MVSPSLNNQFSANLAKLTGTGATSLYGSTVSNWSGSGSGVWPNTNMGGSGVYRPGTNFPAPNMGVPGSMGGSGVWPNTGPGMNNMGGSGVYRPGTNFPAPNMGVNNMGGSGVWPNTNMGGSGVWPNTNMGGSGIWSSTGGMISLSGVRCSGGRALSLGSQAGGRPIRLSCQGYSDVCSTPQQCAELMCSRYIRCPGTRIAAA